MLEVRGGVKGLHADAASPWRQKEFITQGQFVVENVTEEKIRVLGRYQPKDGARVTVVLRQGGVYGGAPAGLPPRPEGLGDSTKRERKGTS